MALYAVVMTLPIDISNKIDAFRHDYIHYVNYTIEPHITLIQPFMPEIDITGISEKLKAVADKTKSFTLVMNGIEYFEGTNNVVYVAVESKNPVITLHSDIINSLAGLIKDEYQSIFILDRYTPHVTIGEQIPAEIFPDVKKRFMDIGIAYETEMNSFSLFSGSMNGVWKKSEVFGFSG